VKKFFCLLLLTLITFTAFSQETKITTITIMSARQTSYKKAITTGNDTIELEGSVVLAVTKDNTTTEIKADKVTYDRKTEMLYAEGNVEIDTKGSSSGGEKTTANSLLMNTSTLEGIFDGGRIVQTKSDALNLPSGSTLIVFSEIFGKSTDNIISFKNSSLTFCDDENPHWHIDATRTWLLPGGEFAFFNALLYVGVVPVLYFPAFYYPKDELVFNPVFSYTEREGTSIQTTTYLWGRKPLSSGSSSSSSSSSDSDASTSAESLKALYNFVKPSTLKEQRLEGIVLHNLDEDYTGDTSQYVKFLADWYSNLGVFTGLDANFQPKNQYISKFAFKANMGFSNTVFKNEEKYYPFAQDGTVFYDTSNFMGKSLPFRFSGNLEFALSKPFSLTLTMPIYSDPFYSSDFLLNRVETMDWISYFLENNTESSSKTNTVSEISSFNWQLNTSYSPGLPNLLKPYISSVSIRTSSTLNFTSKNVEKRVVKTESSSSTEESLFYKDKDGIYLEETADKKAVYADWRTNTPNRRFYYPSSITPGNIDLSLSGTLFSWPLEKKSKSTKSLNFLYEPNKPDELKTEKQLEEEAKKREEEALAKESENKENTESVETKEEVAESTEEKEEENPLTYNIPDLDYTPGYITVSDGLKYTLGYSIGTNITSQIAYSPKMVYTAEDFDWENVRSYMYNIKIPMNLNSNLSYGGNFFSSANTFSYTPVYQDHPYVSDDVDKGGYTEKEIQTLWYADYTAENRDLVNTNNLSLRPFVYSEMFSDSNVSWNSTYKLYRKKFTGTAEEPEWEVLPFDIDDDTCVTSNTIAATVSAKQLSNFKQNLTFSAVLPPLLKQYTATLGLTFPYVSASFSTGFQETTKDPKPGEDRWKKSPFNQSLSVSLFNSKLSLSQNYVYNIEDEHHESFKLSASAYGMSLGYTMTYTTGYDFDSDTGWTARTDKEFLPYALNFSYGLKSKTYYTWLNRISFAPGLNFNLTADLIRPTNSYLVFSPSITFKIHEFFNLTFSSSSKNSILYWYFNEGLYDEGGVFPGNMFKDLADSFNFSDKTKREGSGFKLNSLNMSLSHELHDWKFNMTAKIEPRLLKENGKAYYDFNPYITIGVVWNPMESIKTSIIDDYGEWKLE